MGNAARPLGSMTDEVSEKTAADYHDLISKLQDMPTLPVVAMKVNQLINDPNTTSGEVAAVLKQDQVLTAKILRLVNSSYYAVPGGVTDVKKALAFLGFNTVAQLVLSVSVFSMFSKLGSDDLSLADFWQHALATAIVSETLAKKTRMPRPDEVFTCGLLHDIGKLSLLKIDPKRFTAILKESKEKGVGFIDIEREHEYLSHAYIGDLMAQKWSLPQVVRYAIRYHHHDVSHMDSLLPSEKKTVQIVRLANAYCVSKRLGHSGDFSDGGLKDELLAPLELKAEDLFAMESEIEPALEKAGAFLNASS
jgi:putative nucleotidyltransferase with HDIG domain